MFGFGKKKGQNAASPSTAVTSKDDAHARIERAERLIAAIGKPGDISKEDALAMLHRAEKLIAAAAPPGDISKEDDLAEQDEVDRHVVEANERAMASGEFINATDLRRIALATGDQALVAKINRMLAQGRSLSAKEATQDMDTLSAGKARGDLEAAVKAVVERNEKALISAGYVNTYALTVAVTMTNDPKLRERINRIAGAKGLVIMRGDDVCRLGVVGK